MSADVSIIVSAADDGDPAASVASSSTYIYRSTSTISAGRTSAVHSEDDDGEYFGRAAAHAGSGADMSPGGYTSEELSDSNSAREMPLLRRRRGERSTLDYGYDGYFDEDSDEFYGGDDRFLTVGGRDYVNNNGNDDNLDGPEYLERDDEWNSMFIDDDNSYTIKCGYLVLFSTWIIVVMGVGSIFNVWTWVWTSDKGTKTPRTFESDFPIDAYYPSMIMLLCVVAWIWCIISWVGMKLFRHAKGGVSSDAVDPLLSPESPITMRGGPLVLD
ncbi:uncharacterized protein V1518DRAFT_425393 [Limtongia smithiae]|uniref:uncharacterized protein n=1 Tax=Limtongia smithiae TaxID=1125753 RepID=UPI0034CD1C47